MEIEDKNKGNAEQKKNKIDEFVNLYPEVKEELQWMPYKDIDIKSVPYPLAKNPDIVSVELPTLKYPLNLSVTYWEKMWLIATTLGRDIDLLIKLLPIILPIITIIRWATNLNKKEKQNA